MHGGNSDHAKGTRNSAFKHGRHSKYLPTDLDQVYREAKANTDILDMAENVALLETRINQVLSASGEGPVPRWSNIKEIIGGLTTALLSDDKAKSIDALAELNSIIDNGDRWDRTWDEVRDNLEQIRKLTDTEVKRRKDLNQMIPIERVMVLMGAVGHAVKMHVTDPAQIDAVYREIGKLQGATHSADGKVALVPMGPPTIDVTPSDSFEDGE